MSETLIPTGRLRWFTRATPSAQKGMAFGRQEIVLQQSFTTPGGKPLWEDVPFEEEIPGG